MEREVVATQLTEVFKTVFKNESFILKDELTANDVDGWDSLTHMLLISSVEEKFGVKFRLKELNKMRNIGDMIDILIQKL